MLILTRKIDEEIKIGKDITLKILSISENQIKVGIQAPNNVQIYRGELFDKVIQNTQQASKAVAIQPTDLTKYRIQKVK